MAAINFFGLNENITAQVSRAAEERNSALHERSKVVSVRVMTDTEAQAYGVDLHKVRSERAKRAAAAAKARRADPERQAQSETVEHFAETGEVLTW